MENKPEQKKPSVKQLEFFHADGSPTSEANLSEGEQSVNGTHTQASPAQEVKKDEPQLPMSAQRDVLLEKEDDEDDGYEYDWQRIHNR